MAPCKNLQDLARQFEQDFPVGEFALPECSGTEDSSCHLDDIASEMGELESQLDSILREESELKCQQTKLEANIKKLESSLNEKVDWKKQLRELKKRKTKAEARLSQNDVDFMASIQIGPAILPDVMYYLDKHLV
ncbi:hypothetical protein AAG570_011148 [Ranatra chinensis]|uniref:Uncharacterized protein n=1 Tax=Ranatra chinensis TaxID=642074 RepID=A0ABD0YJS7_9HEMI